MGSSDELYEWLDAFKRAMVIALAIAGIGYLVWRVAAGWLVAGALGAGIVLMLFTLDAAVHAAVYSVAYASRRVVRIVAMVLLALSVLVLALTNFTVAGAVGAVGALTFLACDFAMQRDEDRIRLESD